jgi:hypothetical protein
MAPLATGSENPIKNWFNTKTGSDIDRPQEMFLSPLGGRNGVLAGTNTAQMTSKAREFRLSRRFGRLGITPKEAEFVPKIAAVYYGYYGWPAYWSGPYS